jgi:hypothetical protein
VTQVPDPDTGELTYDTDSQGNVIPLTTQAAADMATILKNYASNIDITRKLTLFMGYLPY